MGCIAGDDRSGDFCSLDELIESILPEVIALRQDLHANPELGYKEVRTAKRIVDVLRKVPGIEIRTEVAETGVVALLGAGLPAPVVALRADMDALPIEEQTGLDYRSRNPGVMHACGHDGHVAMLVGAALVLGKLRDRLEGPVKFIFQPAEEGGAGGRRMIEEGVLEDPSVSAIFGTHNWPTMDFRMGQFGLCEGPAMAGTASFRIEVRGRGGHAATPHRCVDPIFIGSQIVSGLQGVVARGIDPLKAAVLSVTQFIAGTTHNVIPESATIQGTMRALDPEVLRDLGEQLRRRAEGVAGSMGAEALVEIFSGYPVLYNGEASNHYFRRVAADIGRGEDLISLPPTMGGEDFAYYAEKIPGTFWFLGSRPSDRDSVPFCHDPRFDFNDAVIADGIRMHVELARRFACDWR